MGKQPKPGARVVVCDEDGRPLFRGTLADTEPPWWGWSRVIPDGYIDLPPKYKIGSADGTEAV